MPRHEAEIVVAVAYVKCQCLFLAAPGQQDLCDTFTGLVVKSTQAGDVSSLEALFACILHHRPETGDNAITVFLGGSSKRILRTQVRVFDDREMCDSALDSTARADLLRT